ncbi:Lacal_2735 family protein [Persicobacter psychrovividus]|uniref:Lacal_2735 family protein n=1 Tax=Persicobacter psychrovividus TaxID=387638 RepID=A0ABN6LE73_9BACT|nr:hypothetical protein PEPS_34290 [Persicobacter psychrovividus]
MFGLFKKKSKKEILQKKYEQLMEAYFHLSKTNRRASDEKYMAAQSILKQIEALG